MWTDSKSGGGGGGGGADADQGVGYADQSFNGRNANNGVDAYGVAQGAIADLAAGFGDVIIVGGESPPVRAPPGSSDRS